MNDHCAEGNYFTINHLVLFTGLTDRTIRSYISSGVLQGEKINGIWHFTPEQTDAFISHPAVRPSILAKQNAVIYDFLLDGKKREHQCCMILDLPGDSSSAVTEFFCQAILDADLHDFHFSFDGISSSPRVILKGVTSEVTDLVSRYYSSK